MYNEEDRKWLYEQMKQSGVDTGSYDDFKQSLNNQEDREWYYNKSKELKLDVGSQQDFDDMMVEPVAAQPQQPASPAPTPMQPAQSTPINGYKQPQFDAYKLQRPDQRTDLEKTFDMIHGQLKQANQQQAQKNDEFWRNDPTMQQRQQYNQRNGIALDPTVPSDQRGIRLGVQRPSALDMGNPRYASIIKNDEAVNAGMDVFGKELQRIEEAGRQHLKDAAGRNTPSTSPDGYLGPDMATMREASEISDPSLAIQSAVDQMTAQMLQDDYFTTDGENLNDAGRYALQTMQQRMIQQLVEKRMPQSSAEYIVLNAIRNSDFGKLTRMATSTPFQNYLDDLAVQSYQPGFWERVGTGALTFGLNMPEYALTGAAGGGLSKFMTGGLTKIVTNGLVRRGVERSVAKRAAQMVMSNTLTGRAAQIGSTAVHGATTFGLQPVIGTPVDLTYKAGQPINPDGSTFTPELDDYIGETWKEMKKGAAMGTLMVGGTVAAVPEKIAQGAVKEGLIRGALGFGYDAGVMAGFSLHDMKEADPTFEITPESAAEAYAESAASLGLLKLPHMFGMKGHVEQARQAQKFKFTPEEKQYLREMGIDDPVELALRMANRGAEQPSFLKSILRNDERTPQAQTGKEIVKDDAEPIDAENMQQLSAAYRSFMASEAPETMKAKVMYLIEGKMPAQFSPVTGTRIVEDGSKIYVETLNQRGGVIERKPMRSYEEALAEQNRLGFQADMNTTEAIQNRLDELETATDMSNMLKESYEAIRRKAVSDPDKLTVEDRELLSMAQNIPAILQKANEGTELTPSEQSLLNAAFSRLNAYKQKNGAGKRIAAEVEDMYDLNVGEVERAMYGHSKAEAEELAGGNGIVEIGNGIYRTEQEQQIVSEYRQRMLQRIQEHEALRQTETEAQTQEGTVQQPVDTSRMIEGEVPQEPVAETPPPPADTEGDNGGGESKYTAPSFDIETSRQRGRDAYYTQDQPTIKSIGHEMKMADVRMFRYFPSEEAMRIDEAVKTGNLESIDTESMTAQQRDAFVKYVNAYAEAEGFKAAMEEHHQQQAALDEAAIEPYRNEAGEIIPLTLDNGQQAYHKSGDLANKFGTVTVTYTDETGKPKTTNWPVSKIKEQGTAMPAGQFAERLSADLAEQSGNRVMNWLLGNNVEAGQQVELTIAGETMPFTVDGFYPDGDIQLSDGDGNIMKMTKEEVLNMMEATDQLQIETQLQQEAAQFREAQRQQREADRQAEIAQRTERYNNGIVGMKEGNPDFTAEGSDPAVVAEYLLGSSRQQEQTIAEVKPQVINDIQQSKDELKTRQTEAQQELSRVISQLSVGKDILDTDEAQQLEQRQTALEAELQDLDARQRRWADVRSNLMTKEEVQQFETERRSDVSQARKGLRPAEQNRNFGQNDEHIAVNEDGTMNFGLTPTGNANNYLLRHFQDSFDAEKFMNDQRIALRNKQRDEVQPQIDALNGQLNDYISGRIELTPEELKQISQSVTDLEAYQDALTREASHMREIVEGISELYERNGRNEPSTPQEQRMEAMSKARSAQDKLRIAREIYKDDPQAISAINDMEPRDIAEYISQNLGRGTINWEGFDRGDHHVRGLREELGSGWERGISRGKSTNAFNMYLAAKGQGKGIEEIVHDLYEAQPDMNGGGKMYSTEDLRNGIIDLLSTARTPSDISHLTINNRIAEADQYVRAMEEYEEREAELAELGMPDNDAIREWIPSVSEQEYTPEVIAYLDGAFADYIESLGGDRETYEDAMRQLAADEELTFNEIAEYERNEPAADGQRPSGTSNRVDEKPVTAGVPEGSNQGKEDLSATQAHDNDGHPAIEAGQPQQSAPESGTAGSGESLAVQPQGGIEKGKKSNIQGLETYSEDEILNQVRDYFDAVRGDNDADAEIVGMKIIGSRTNGTANDDSDLDVLLEYKGKAREDDLFNMLSGTDEPLTIEGIRVDINPITKGKSGTIEEFMRRNSDYRKETPTVFKDRLETAKADTNTEPTEAQKKAGNYKMGHVEFGGYNMSIENPKGSVRSGVDQNGKPWSIEMKDTYGYIGKKYGADGDHLDFFINDDADLDNFKGRVYVVDQKNEDGTFDEHKVMYGYPTWGEAKKAYERNYEPGWWDKHVMQMLAVPKDRFDKWLSDSDRKTKPYADYFRLKYDNPISDPIEEVKANIRERQNSIMDQVKQSASVVQARAEAAIQKKEPTLKPADIKSMTDDELQKSRKKRSSVASTARFLLGTTNIEKGGEKWNTLQETIRQQQADMDAIDDELQSRRERSREELENVLTDRETGGALVEHLQDMGIDVTTDVRENRRIRKQAENDKSENGELRRMHTPDGKTYGFAYRGKLYLDPRKIDGKLPIHEYAHLWSEALRKLNPDSWNNVVSLIKADADTWRFVQERNPEITDENALVEEVIATASGERGQERLKAEYERMSKRDGNYTSKWGNIWKNISKALQDFWKQVTDFLHINYKSAAQVYDQVLKDFVDGVNPRRKVEDWLERRNNDYMEAVQKGEKEKASAIFMEALKEEVGNGITPFVAVDKYRNVSSLAKRVKSRDAEAVREVAEMMKPLIPENAVLVPVPSHTGEATDMLDVAKVLGELTGSEVADVLKGAPRASQYDTKKETGAAISSSDLGIRMEGQLPEGKLPIIIDNVVDTGNTAEACVQALGRGVVVSLGRSVDDTHHAATLKSADPIVTNRRGDVVPLDERFDLGGSKYMFRPYEDMASEPVPEREVASVVKMEPKSPTDTEKREAKVRQAATKAVLSALDNAGVKYKVVSQEEANQMMSIYAAVNEEPIVTRAKKFRPDWHKRYAVVNTLDPYAVPQYFEKKRLALEHTKWANRGNGKKYTMVDMGYPDEVAGGLSNAAQIAEMIQPMVGWHGSQMFGWTDGQQIYLTEAGLNPNTPVHEYTHIWAKYIMKSDPELWKIIVSTMKKTDMWKQIEKNKNYKGIWENDDQMASEVLSRLSGATSEEEFMKAAATKKGSKAIIDQVKSVLRRFWEAVKRLFGSTGKTIGNVTNSWQSIVRMPLRDLLEGVNPVGEETGTMAQRGDIVQKTLMGVHNISEVKLRKALKQGGLANPSLAVIDTKNGMHNDYGEISLIPKSSLIDSKKGRNAGTFAGDAWTPTYPQVEKIMSDKGLDAYYKDVRNVSENRELTGQLKMVWENYLDGSDPGRLAYWYLKEKGIEPENSYFDSGYTEEQRKRFAEITDNGSKGFLDMNDEERSGVIAMIAEKEGISLEEKLAKYQALRNKNAEILAKGEKKPFTKILQRTIEEIDKYGITLTPVSDFLYGMKKAINSDGKLNVGGTLQNARDRMQADGMEADFNRWLEEKEQKYGVKEMLFDGFTRDGYRKYIPNTLQNASRMMNREADANSGGQTGFGASRAMLLGKMQSLADIRKQKGKLHGIDEDTQQRYDEASDEMFEVVKALSNMQKISDNPFSNVDYANARLNEALQQKDPISYLNKEFGYNIEKDGDFAKGLKTMLQNVEDLPVKYFETKFKRPVMLDEFTVAIVPENTSAEVVKALQDAGLDVRTYDNTGDEAIRNENRRLATMEAVGMRDDILFHIEDDTETVKRLDNEPTEIGYRNVVLNDDGSLGSPMANRLGKKGVARRPTTMFAFDKWERSDENPDLATEDGKIDLIKPGNKEVGGVDYNPYIHIRPTLVNKQFKQAWERPNLVYIRTKYPVSELDGGYKAEKAKLSVGKHPWGGGELILSRWDKPQEIVPWEEVADDWVKEFQGEKGIHFDIIPPKLLPILVERGMNILPPHKGMGKKCMEAYEKFKSETIRRMAANGNSDASKGRFLFDGESVIDVIGTEFQKSDKSIVDTVSKFFMEEYGGEANRQDIGKILLDNRAVKNDIGHGLNRIKAATFAAVHDIIEQGVIIDKKNEWKGKQTESYIIAAPITIAGERYVGMAIVKRSVDGKRLYLHGVITQKSLQDEALKTDPKVERRQGDVAKILINLHKANENAKKLQKGGENHQKMIDEVNREAENLGGVKVNIVSSDDIKDENMRHEMHMGTKGIYDPNTGEVSLLVDNIDSIDEAKRVVFHEKLGHEGLKALLGSNEAVMKFGNFLFGTAGKTLRRKMVDRAEEEGWKMDDRERWSKAAQEVFSDIAADGPATPEEFDLWTKAKHYLIRLLKAMNIRIRGLLNDHDLRYYVLKTGYALKWNKLDTSARENLATQETHFEPMRASGKPRRRNNESQAQYFQRLREWERRRIAEEQDPEPQMPEIDNDAMTAEYDEYRKQWNRNHGLPEDYDDMGMPRRESGESDADYMERIRLHEAYEREMQSGDPLQPIFGWEPQAMKDWRQAFADWKRRNDIREEENVDLNLYEGNGIEPGDPITESEIDARMLRELGEATGTDTTPEGAKHHVKMAIIERRKDLESSNAEDAVFLHQLGKQIAHVAKLQGVKPEELNSALPFIIEDTYFDEIVRDENGNVIAINDISDQLPIKRTPELQSLLDTIKDWYDEFYHVLDDAGLRGKAGYIEEGYVNHVWDKEKSDPKAWEKYVEQYQRLRSPNMKQRMIESYQVGIDLGLKPKFDKLTDIMAYYSKSNNEAVANKGLMQHLSCLNIQEVNSDGEVVLNTPLLYSKQPDGLVRDRYSTFYVPGIGDIWVYKEAASKFANVFGPVTTPGEKAVSQKFWKVYDLIGSTAKKIQLSFSAFHAGALTEVYLAQGMAGEGPVRAMKQMLRSLVYDCIRTGELPAMANPEDFKLAASHLVKLGATDDYAAADVLRLTDKFRQFASDMDKRFGMNKVGVGPLGVVGFAVDAINKGMDTLLWSYLHDGLKIAMFKMFADDLKMKAEKKGWDDEKLDKMLDEAGQYVNDCFGGQYWELIDVSPKLLKGLQRLFLSPDWLLSTLRHFFANFGFGSLYNDGGFWEYVKYNADNLKRVFGADIPKNDFRAFRSRNAKMCYIIGVLFGAMMLSNLANAIFRKQDEEEEREKAAADPSYKSKYDLIAPDGMKWYDYLMMGNANGQTTHMFIGRYEDGTETYIRWGKQFREFPELWTNEKGELEVPWPLVKRMMGKANPNIGIIFDDITYLDPYKATHQDEELQRKYGKPLGLVVKTASKFLPFIVPTQEGKEWKAIDQVFPSSKGFSKWKAQDYFKHYILTDDQQGMELTYKSCVLNGIDPQQQLDAALRSVKAAERQELADGVKDLQGAWEKFNNAQSHTEKLYWQRKLKKYLAESNYDQMNSFEFAEKAKGILGTGDEDMQPMDSKQLKEGEGIYLWLSTAEDVRDDYKVTTLYKKSGEIAKQLRQMEEDGQDTSGFEERNDYWLELRERINEYRRDLKEMKLELGGDDSESVMRRIREARSQLLKEAEELRQ